MTPSVDRTGLLDLRWTRLRVELRNTRADAAREHPLGILHGLFMFAVPPAAAREKIPFLLRPLREVGDAIERDRISTMDVLFPGDDLSVPCACGVTSKTRATTSTCSTPPSPLCAALAILRMPPNRGLATSTKSASSYTRLSPTRPASPAVPGICPPSSSGGSAAERRRRNRA